MKNPARVSCAIFAIAGALAAVPFAAQAAQPTTLTVFAAGTLAVPFKQIDQQFEKKYPDIKVQAQFGGSVKMTKQITELHKDADILAVADYSVIPKYMFKKPAHADWYVGIARNAITFTYTDKSKGAKKINAKNWYKVLAEKGVEIGRSNPDTDPSGYQTVQMLNLANQYYKDPKIEKSVLANAPLKNMRDTETSLISALQLGQIDYLAIYRSDALQHHLNYLKLPDKINLSNPADASYYKKGVAHTKNGTLTGKPIVYAMTIVQGAKHVDAAKKYVAFVLGPQGQGVMKKDGFGSFSPAFAMHKDNMPKSLQKMVKPWPQS
ncbi:MAG TPA: extracellular solute-binding protein [Pseudolabrys sp.]|nr:extracellular solute-binding protein [Pseudolabrys sp.]